MRNGLFLFVLTLAVASGQGYKMAPEERQAILDYQLTLPRANQLMAALPQMTRFVISLPRETLAKSKDQSLAARISRLDNSEQGMAICKQNGLTAKDYIVGVPALRMALWLAEGMPANPDIFASPANLAFAKANLAELHPKWIAAERVTRPIK